MCNQNYVNDAIEEDRNGAGAKKHCQTEEESKEVGNQRSPMTMFQDSMMRRMGPENDFG